MNLEDKFLVADVTILIGALISGELTDAEVSTLRDRAAVLHSRLSQRMRVFADNHGPHVACPLNRAHYLLSECLEHTTLLGPA